VFRKKGEVVEGRVRDPVCGMPVNPSTAYYTELAGKRYLLLPTIMQGFFQKSQNPLRRDRTRQGSQGTSEN